MLIGRNDGRKEREERRQIEGRKGRTRREGEGRGREKIEREMRIIVKGRNYCRTGER